MRRFTTPGPIYPLRATDLSPADLELLTGVLHVDAAAGGRAENKIVERISRLPIHLRRSMAYRLVPCYIAPATTICSLHKGINPYVVANIFELVVDEVTLQFKCMEHFPEFVPPEQTQVLATLKAIQGMWLEPSRARPMPAGTWPFQVNECRACMLCRIAVDRDILCNFRMTLLSRTRTKKKHKAPRLLAFVDECIARHSAWVVDLCYYSGQRAYALKNARKAACKAYRRAKRDSKYQYVLRDQDHVPPSNNAHQVNSSPRSPTSTISRQEAEYERRVDSILACYPPSMDMDSARPVRCSMHSIPLAPEPLRIRKVDQPLPTVSDHREPSSYIPPRDNSNWRRGLTSHPPSPQGSHGKGKARAPNSEELAEEYRSLVTPAEYYSDSEYSDGSWEDAPVYKDQAAAETTWSLFYR
ncbi:hypothetical protein PHISP_00173 [Aspergillus sp. HF37]|nr:hypothetical protein PHISP_00173 [Aspergillus sp. HF37]